MDPAEPSPLNVDRPVPAPNLAGKELFTTTETAHFLSVSPRMVQKMDADHLIPAPVRMGSAVRWSRRTLQQWIVAGCPSRGEFITLQSRSKCS